MIDETGQGCHPVCHENTRFIRVRMALHPLRQPLIAGERRLDDLEPCELGGVVTPTGREGRRNRVLPMEGSQVAGQLQVQGLLCCGPVERVETGAADEDAGEHPGPGVVERQQTDPGFFPDRASYDLGAVLHFGQDGTVEVQVEMEATGTGGAIGCRGDGRIDEPSNRHLAGSSDTQEQSQLLLAVEPRDGDNDFFSSVAAGPPNSLQMGVGKIRCSEMMWERSSQWIRAEILPETAVEPAGLEAGNRNCVEADQEGSAVNYREPGAGSRDIASWTHHHEPGVHEFQRFSFHGFQGPWCRGSKTALPAWR